MISDYNIYCFKTTWSENTPYIDINFFSSVQPDSTEPILLNNYLIDMDDLEYTFDDTKYINYTNLINKEASDITFEISGIENNKFMQSYFEVFSDTTFIKYLIKIVEKSTNKLLWIGIVNQNRVTEPFTPTRDSEIISVHVIGLEKEFKEYYSEKKLPDADNISWEKNIKIPITYPTPPTIPIKKFDNLLNNDLFNSNFLQTEIENDIKNKYVSKISNFYYHNEGFNNNIQVGETSFANGTMFRKFGTAKNQILYTANEMSIAGLEAGNIQEIQFMMLNEEPDTGNNEITGLKISIKHTSATSLTDFDNSGFTQVFFRNQYILNTNGQHWEKFELDNTFNWNGTDNLLIEICFYFHNNKNAFIYGHQNSDKFISKSTSPGMGGCTYTSGASNQLHRPAIKIAIGEVSNPVQIFIRCGYDRIQKKGITCYDYFEKLCNTMGWHYTFYNGKLIIRNLDGINFPVYELDYQNFEKFEISKLVNQNKFKDILIPDGNYDVGSEVVGWVGNEGFVSGNRMHLNSVNETEIPINWWVVPTGRTGQRYVLVSPYNNFKSYKDVSEEDDKYFYKKDVLTWNTDEVPIFIEEITNLKKDETLFIDGGEGDKYGVDCQYGEQGESYDNEYRFNYSGNFGNSIVTIDNFDYLNETYLEYVKKQQFKNNFSKYLKNSKNIVIDIQYNGVINEPFKRFKIIGNEKINEFWYLNKLKINFKTKTTYLTLIKSLN